jgi:gliding motility-associated-like protein
MKRSINKKIKYAAFVCLILILNQMNMAAQCNRRTDSLALVALYNATNGRNWTVKNVNGQVSPWVLTQPMTKWYGIELGAQGCVTNIDLDGDDALFGGWSDDPPGMNLVGSLTDSLRFMTDVWRMSLRGNRNLVGVLPNRFGQMTALEFFFADNCGFTTPFPNTFWGLKNIKEIDLDDNPLNTTLPPEFSQLKTLNALLLSNTGLSGSIPTEWGSMTNLSRLDLWGNNLTGAVPPSLTNLTNLQYFNIENNRIDSLPNLSSLPFQQVIASWETGFDIINNNLTFDDILPNMPILNKVVFSAYQPQKTVGKDTLITKAIGETATLAWNIDGALTTNKYVWFKNGVALDSSNINRLILRGVALCDSGTYTCRVTNPSVARLILNSPAFRLKITGTLPTNLVNARIANGDNYQLPNGRQVSTAGVYRDTLRKKNAFACDSLVIVTNLVVSTNDTELTLGITPNNDGLNDALVFDELNNTPPQYPDAELIVRSRWGSVVFEEKNYHNQWTGTGLNGQPLPAATYFFILKLDKNGTATRRGSVTIVRN